MRYRSRAASGERAPGASRAVEFLRVRWHQCFAYLRGSELKRVLRFLLFGSVAGGLAAASLLGWIWHRYQAPGTLTESTRIVIPRGSSATEIAALLAKVGAISDTLAFRVGTRLDGSWRELKAGEYEFPAMVSARDAARLITSGKTVVRRLTLAEGITTAQALVMLREAEGLTGEVDRAPSEGELLPDTYFYSWGDSRDAMLARQTRAMRETLAELWPKRALDLPLKSPLEAVILASIVEKETGIPEERPRIAAVFLNRIRRGMRLQADPTVIYGLTEGRGPLDRPLSRADLQVPHPWNTYVIGGLPPTPIANPGRAALEAVLNPAETDEIYFVADGSGRHVFARTLSEHMRNVRRLRKLERERVKPQ